MIENLYSIEKRRIMLMYITKVSGHRQATLAIQKALREIDSTIEAPTINGFGYTYPILEKVVNQAYMSVIKSTPKVWEYMYDNPKIVKNSVAIKNFLHRTSHEKIDRLFQKYHPDTVVCTQAFPCGMVADYKREKKLNTLLVGVLTDFAPHSFWINEGVDYYVVPSEDARSKFIAKGIDPEKIRVFGIPLQSKFAVRHNKLQIAERLGLDPNKPIVLIMGGGQGLGPIKAIVKSLDKIKLDVQLITTVGINKKALSSIRRFASKSSKSILIYEFANNVDELMDVADLIVTKPGGMTTAESLVKGLPMIIIDPIPGQEMRNTEFLIKQGIAVHIDESKDIGEEVELLLRSPQKLSTMSQNAQLNAKPNAASDIARLILGPQDKSSTSDLESAFRLENYV